jgi:hypothetical protein
MQQALKLGWFGLGWLGAITALLWLGTVAFAQADDGDGASSYANVTATVVAVQRNWRPAEPTDTPRAGAEFVTVGVQVDNDSGRPAEVNMFRFTLVTVDGSQWRPIAKREPYLSSDLISTDASVNGWLTFEIPRGLRLAQLLWRPSFDRTVAIDL